MVLANGEIKVKTTDAILVGANSNISGRNINFVSDNTVQINGILQTSGKTISLLVNPDSSIDPVSDINATIIDDTIFVDPVSSFDYAGTSINLTGNVTGTGTLRSLNGEDHINITNYSSNDLFLDELGINGGSQHGRIIINGNNITSDYNDITVILGDSGNDVPTIDVSNNAESDLIIGDSIYNERGITSLYNQGGNIIADNQGIYSGALVVSTPISFDFLNDPPENLQYIGLFNTDIKTTSDVTFISDGLLMSGSSIESVEGDINILTTTGTILLPDFTDYIKNNTSVESFLNGDILGQIVNDIDQLPDPVLAKKSSLAAGNDINIQSGFFFTDIFSTITASNNFTSDSVITVVAGDSLFDVCGDITINALNDENFGVIITAGMNDFDNLADIFGNIANHSSNANDMMGFMFCPLIQSYGSLSLNAPTQSELIIPDIMMPLVNNNLYDTMHARHDDIGLILISNSMLYGDNTISATGDVVGVIDSSLDTYVNDINITSTISTGVLPNLSFLPLFLDDQAEFTYHIKNIRDALFLYPDLSSVPNTYLRAGRDININQGVLFTSVFNTMVAGRDYTSNSIITEFIGHNTIQNGGNTNIFAVNADNIGAIYMLGIIDPDTELYFDQITTIESGGSVNILSLNATNEEIMSSSFTWNDFAPYKTGSLPELFHFTGMQYGSIQAGADINITGDVTAAVGTFIATQEGEINIGNTMATLMLPGFIPLLDYIIDPDNTVMPDDIDPDVYYQTVLYSAGSDINLYSGLLFADIFSDVWSNGGFTSDSTISVLAGMSNIFTVNDLNLRAINDSESGIITVVGLDSITESSEYYYNTYGEVLHVDEYFGFDLKIDEVAGIDIGLNEFFGLKLDLVKPDFRDEYSVLYSRADLNIDTGLLVKIDGAPLPAVNPLQDLHIVGTLESDIYAEGDINIISDITGMMGTKVKAQGGTINVTNSTTTLLLPDLVALLPYIDDPSLIIDEITILPGDPDVAMPPMALLPDLSNIGLTSFNARNDININSGQIFGDLFANLTAGGGISTTSIVTAIIGNVNIEAATGDVNILATNSTEQGLILMMGPHEYLVYLDKSFYDQGYQTNLSMVDYMGMDPVVYATGNINILSMPAAAPQATSTAPVIENLLGVDIYNEIDANYVAIIDYYMCSQQNININGDIVGIQGTPLYAEAGNININSSMATIFVPDFIPLFELLEDDQMPINKETLSLNDRIDYLTPGTIYTDLTRRTELKALNDINLYNGLLFTDLFSDIKAGNDVIITSSVITIAGDSAVNAGNDINIQASNMNEKGLVVILGAESLLANSENQDVEYYGGGNATYSDVTDPFDDFIPGIISGNTINISSEMPLDLVVCCNALKAGADNITDFLNELPEGHNIGILDYQIMAPNGINISSGNATAITGSMITSDFGDININSGTETYILPSYTLFMDEILNDTEIGINNLFLSTSINSDIPAMSNLSTPDIKVLNDFYALADNSVFDDPDAIQYFRTNLMSGGNININSGILFTDLYSDIMASGSFSSTSIVTVIGGDSTIMADSSINIMARNANDAGMILLLSNEVLGINNDNGYFFAPMIMSKGNINVLTTIRPFGTAAVPIVIDGIGQLPEETFTAIADFTIASENGNVNMTGDYVAIMDSSVMAGNDININSSMGTILSPISEEIIPLDGVLSAYSSDLPMFFDFGDDNKTEIAAGNNVTINSGGLFANINSSIMAGEDFTSTSVLTVIIGGAEIMTEDDMDIYARNDSTFGAIFILGLDDLDLFDIDFDEIPSLFSMDDITLDADKGSNLFGDLGLITSEGFNFYMDSFDNLSVVGILDSVVFAMDDLDIDADIVIVEDSFVESGRNLLISAFTGTMFLPGGIPFLGSFIPGSIIPPVVLFNEMPLSVDPEGFPDDLIFDDLETDLLTASEFRSGGDIIIESGNKFANLYSTIDAGGTLNVNSSNSLFIGNTASNAMLDININSSGLILGTFANTGGLIPSFGLKGSLTDNISADKITQISSITNRTEVNAMNDINFNVTGQSINGGTIVSYNGNLNLNTPSGGMNLDYISAPGYIDITSLDSVDIGIIDPIDISIITQSVGSSINIGQGIASGNVGLQSDNINVNFQGTSTTTPLGFNISGLGGGFATNAFVNIGSSTGAVINTLQARDASISTRGGNLIVNNARIIDQATFTSNTLTTTVTNVNTNRNNTITTNTNTNADVSLATTNNESFNYTVNSQNKITTNAAFTGSNTHNAFVNDIPTDVHPIEEPGTTQQSGGYNFGSNTGETNGGSNTSGFNFSGNTTNNTSGGNNSNQNTTNFSRYNFSGSVGSILSTTQTYTTYGKYNFSGTQTQNDQDENTERQYNFSGNAY